jgi:exodeoxyribonuclease V alpha subunit
MPETIVAMWESEQYRADSLYNSWVLGRVNHGGNIIGCSGRLRDGEEFKSGHSYRFFGRWCKYRGKKGFSFSSFVEASPHSEIGITKYIAKNCKGIGAVTAKKIFDEFGNDSLRVMRYEPKLVSERCSIGLDKCNLASGVLENIVDHEAITVDLMSLISGLGVPESLIATLIRCWGVSAAKVVKNNPYRLMDFSGVGLSRCDSLFMRLHPRRASCLKRQAWFGYEAIRKNPLGHVWVSYELWERTIRTGISGCNLRPLRALELAVRHGSVAVREDSSGMWLACQFRAEEEEQIADWACSPSGNQAAFPIPSDLSDHQAQKCSEISGRVSVITGSPGTGKTYVAARIIGQLPRDEVAVIAPTGKAAVRISEALRDYDVRLTAGTIHSLLKPIESLAGGWAFQHGPKNPLSKKYYIIDEGSMVDLGLFCQFINALPSNATLLVCGDVGQLLPIGPGAPLRDLISGGVPTAELTEIRRNSGTIVNLCHAIRYEKDWPDLQASDSNVKICHASGHERQISQLMDVIDSISLNGLDPIWDFQLLTPLNDNSPVARNKLNVILRNRMNPAKSNNPFWLHDKVMCTRNGYYETAKATESDGVLIRERLVNGKTIVGAYVANGEIGQVHSMSYQDGKYVIKIPGPERLVRVNYKQHLNEKEERIELPNWQLAYAISYHKSQGSEWAAVGMILDPAARRLCSREMIYTGLSRAKKICYPIGTLNTMKEMCRGELISKRQTWLAKLLDGKLNG